MTNPPDRPPDSRRAFVFLLRITLLICGLVTAAFGQKSPEGLWEHLPQQVLEAGAQRIVPEKYRTVRIDRAQLEMKLGRVPRETEPSAQLPETITLPMPDGSFARFSIVETQVMAPALAAKYPEIKTYIARGLDDPSASARIDNTPQGFHAQILSPKGAVYIDPLSPGDRERAITYYKRDYRRAADEFQCYVEGLDTLARTAGAESALARTGSELRTYRLACATTGEYAQYHGGTVPLALTAVVTAVNRVTGVYEVELSIRLELVANNDLLIYTNSSTDPYTNNNPSSLLSENQSNIDSVIGNANYDIGHVFSTGGGGLAGLGVVGITGSKARGETGLSNPIGDAFYIDFVAHEMGHQFGGNHTFNGDSGSCSGSNRNGSTAYEPGSGSTIQAYAGICGNDDLQAHSDPYFHSVSLDEMLAHVDGTVPSVGTRTATGNTVPTVNAGSDYTIPANTPFVLTASGSDPDGDETLTYNWEERDIGPQQDLSAGDNGMSPIFRSWNATADPSRTFPRLSDLVNNSTPIGETLPTTTRTMNFRATVRDNATGGGGVNTDDMVVHVVNTNAAFAVTSPNTAVNWPAFSDQTITWNVAGTTANGINTPNVSIYLSTDGGLTYPVTVSASTPNDGSEVVSIPNLQTTQARIRVQGEGNIFFDISDQNFTIDAPELGFVVDATPTVQSVCAPDDAVYNIDITGLSGFSDPVTLSASGHPAGTSVSFATNPLTPGNSTTMTVSGTGAATSGIYLIEIQGNSASLNDTAAVSLELSNGPPDSVTLLSPAQATTGVSTTPTLTWTSATQPVSYRLEIDDDPAFGSPEYTNETESTTDTPPTDLLADTPYYWRVISLNECDETATDFLYFTTEATPSNICSTPDVPIPDNNSSGISDQILTDASGTLTDLNVAVDITHTWVGDLTVELLHVDTGTSVILIAKPGTPGGGQGSDADNIDVTLDDEAALSVEDNAPYTPGDAYYPNNPLSAFDGESLAGTWELTVIDSAKADTGTLVSWCLIPTTTGADTVYPLLTIDAVTVAEDVGSVMVPFSLSAASASEISLSYTTADGSALAGSDYTATTDLLTIDAGVTAGFIEIPVLTDEEVEADETFHLILSAPLNVIIPDNEATVTLTDASPPLLLWLDGFGLGTADLYLDSDYDGILTVIEYAFNLDPTQNLQVIYDPLAPVGAEGPLGLPRIELTDAGANSRLQIIFPRRKASTGSGLTYSGSFSGDLSLWTDQAPDSVESIDAEWEKVTIDDPFTLETAPEGKRFGKVNVLSE